ILQGATSAVSRRTSGLMVRNPASVPPHHEELQYLAGVHDSLGIEQRLDAAHQFDRALVLDVRQLVALEHADAVLGGNRSAHPQYDVEHHRVDRMPLGEEIRGVAADRLTDVV